VISSEIDKKSSVSILLTLTLRDVTPVIGRYVRIRSVLRQTMRQILWLNLLSTSAKVSVKTVKTGVNYHFIIYFTTIYFKTFIIIWIITINFQKFFFDISLKLMLALLWWSNDDQTGDKTNFKAQQCRARNSNDYSKIFKSKKTTKISHYKCLLHTRIFYYIIAYNRSSSNAKIKK
jgi:hypothetical protein